ncbi:hypothetical protein BP6252_09624 [Coleophoma cylindrospora]|uniref:F-box domain-containing protein n=1 Tax=Coleophoma cylindrospora TaxID=1849047 RepID=A0A3D8QW48_9HELO|nr:hypothetical protein BP6252_09624 [Coleophoma cylindrospora]
MASHSVAFPILAKRDKDFQQQPGSLSPSFPLLELPFEIRLLIYRYLVPNIFADDATFRKPFRDDGGPCCPALLRANKQIYREAIGEFYGLEYFGLWINPSGWAFARSSGMPIKNRFPTAIRFVEKLALTIYLGNYSDNFNYQAILGDYFTRAQNGPLRSLRLTLLVSIEFFERFRYKPARLRKQIEAELRPLRSGRGLSEVSLTKIDSCHPITVWGHEETFEASMAEFLGVIQTFFDELRIEMISSDGTDSETVSVEGYSPHIQRNILDTGLES